MPFTQEDLDALDTAIATGARDVLLEGRRVLYRSTTEMFTIRRIIQNELGIAPGTRRVRLKGALD